MEINTSADYLEVLRQALEPSVKQAEVEIGDDGVPKLFCVNTSPFDESSDITYMIWPETDENEDTLPMMNIVIELFGSIDASRSDDVRAFLNEMNLYVTIGGFSYIRETGSVMSSHAFYFDPAMTLGDITAAAAKSLGEMEADIAAAGALTAKIISGEMTGAEAIAAFSGNGGDKG
ncbi:MAG: hypothetical protein IJT87_04465 [Ruminiclostridium sp.]|nr:hypothetical protein [Ruminiclostridium sp.]